MTDTAAITINLDHSNHNHSVEAKDLIQQQCYQKLKNQISIDLGNTTQRDRNDNRGVDYQYPPNSGLVYFIDGTRGAGKSTFLRSLYEALPADFENDKKTNLCKLDYIDPSRVENNEIVLLVVLKALKRAVERGINCCSASVRQEKHENFRKAFKQLAGGLSLFVKDDERLKDLDPELFLDWGLERVADSVDLRKNLHAVIEIACGILNVNAFILAFDDADTDANQAIRVLESIRKYLDTPKLITIVTGDVELYTLMVRDHFHSHVSNSEHEKEERQIQRERMVDHLEEQYLLKLFPIHRRVQLRPLWSLLKSGYTYHPTCGVWDKDKTPGLTLIKMIGDLLGVGLNLKRPQDTALFREFLLKQPLRSVLQTLSSCAPYLAPYLAQPKENSNKYLSEELRDSLRALALSSLYKFGVDVDALATAELPALIGAVFDLVRRDGELDTATYLRPQSTNPELNNCFAFLSAEVAHQCAGNPAAMLEYILTGPGSVTLWAKVRNKQYTENLESERITLDQFKQYMGIGRKDDALSWARHATAIITSSHYSKSPTSVRFGVNEIENPKEYFGSVVDLTENSLPVFFLSLVDVSGRGSRTYASIYNILGLMGRLLSLENNDQRQSETSRILSRLHPTLSVSCPPWEDGDDFKDSVLSNNLSRLIEKMSRFLEQIGSWFSLRQESIFSGLQTVTMDWLKVAETVFDAGEEKSDALLAVTKDWLKQAGELQKDFKNVRFSSSLDQDDPVKAMQILVKEVRMLVKEVRIWGKDFLIRHDGKFGELINSTENWLEEADRLRIKINPSAIFLGKIWNRLYFGLEKASVASRSEIGAASRMEKFVRCVIQAFYLEETARLVGDQKELNFDEIIVETMKTESNRLDELPVTKLIATCPLLLGLLNPKIYGTKLNVDYLLSEDQWDVLDGRLTFKTYTHSTLGGR